MPIANILSEIDSEISRLLKVKELLSGTDSPVATRRRGRPAGSGVAKKKVSAALPLIATTQPLRKMSAAGRARISAAMKARWKKVRQAAKKVTAVGATTTQKPLVAAALPKVSAKKSASKKATAKKAASKKSPAKKASPAATTNTSA
jgi:hypothetical protein